MEQLQTLNSHSIPLNNEPVSEVLKQVVNLSFYLWNTGLITEFPKTVFRKYILQFFAPFKPFRKTQVFLLQVLKQVVNLSCFDLNCRKAFQICVTSSINVPWINFRTFNTRWVVWLLFYYLAPLQNDTDVTSRCMQFIFGDKRCVFRPAHACLRMRSHGRKQWKALENYQKSTFYYVYGQVLCVHISSKCWCSFSPSLSVTGRALSDQKGSFSLVPKNELHASWRHVDVVLQGAQ